MLTPASMVSENVALAVFDAESVTVAVKVALPVVGVPESTPPLERFRFTAARLLAPAEMVQVYPLPEPPDATRVCE